MSTSPDDWALGRLAVEANLITAAELEDYLNEVSLGVYPPGSLERLLLETGRATPDVLQQLRDRWVADQLRTGDSAPSLGPADEREIQLLTEHGLLDEEGAAAIRTAIHQWSKEGRSVPVREACLAFGFATPVQLEMTLPPRDVGATSTEEPGHGEGARREGAGRKRRRQRKKRSREFGTALSGDRRIQDRSSGRWRAVDERELSSATPGHGSRAERRRRRKYASGEFRAPARPSSNRTLWIVGGTAAGALGLCLLLLLLFGGPTGEQVARGGEKESTRTAPPGANSEEGGEEEEEAGEEGNSDWDLTGFEEDDSQEETESETEETGPTEEEREAARRAYEEMLPHLKEVLSLGRITEAEELVESFPYKGTRWYRDLHLELRAGLSMSSRFGDYGDASDVALGGPLAEDEEIPDYDPETDEGEEGTTVSQLPKGGGSTSGGNEEVEPQPEASETEAREEDTSWYDDHTHVPWARAREYRSRYYIIKTNIRPEYAKRYGRMMDAYHVRFRRVFRHFLPRGRIGRCRVEIYATQRQFMDETGSGPYTGGFYNTRTRAVTAYHGRFGENGTTAGVLVHEGAHQFQDLLVPFWNAPIWILEGFATFFESADYDPESGKVDIGGIPIDRLNSLKRGIRADETIPLSDLIRTPQAQFGGYHYAHAWGIIYFILYYNEDEEARKKNHRLFTRLFLQARKKKVTPADVESYFGGPEGFREFEQMWKDWIKDLDPDFDPNAKPDEER